jgi:hypothetical protein
VNIAVTPPVAASAEYIRDDGAASENYTRENGETMVRLYPGPKHYFVNETYFTAAEIAPGVYLMVDCLLALPPADCKLSVSDLWQPVSRPTTNTRFMCRECIHWPAGVRKIRGPTVWLNGAGLLTVAQNGFGIIKSCRGSRPRYAKLKMQGELLATPQPRPLSYSLWKDISSVQTKRDPRSVNHRDTAAFDKKDATLKEAEKADAKWGSVTWKAPAVYHEGTAHIFRLSLGHFDDRGRWRRRLPSGPKERPHSWWQAIERLDWLEAFLKRWEAGDIHPVNGYGLLGNRYGLSVRQPGGGEYSPIWYRRRKWLEGNPEGPESKIVYLGTPARDECPPGPSMNKWPFSRMCSRDRRLADLFYVGVTHLNYRATSGLDAKHQDHLYRGRAEQRRAVYRGAVAALQKREDLTGKMVTAVVEKVLLHNASLAGIRWLSTHKNNTLASADLMNVLGDGLNVLADHYRCNGEWEETSWRVSEWADAVWIGEDGHEATLELWPTHWSQSLREFKYREERDSKETRGALRLKCVN